MISIETVNLIRARAQHMDLGDYMNVCDYYGTRKEEVFGYVMSFNQIVSMKSLNELMEFFVFLVLCFEEQYGQKLLPTRKIVEGENKKVRDKVEYLNTSEPDSISDIFELWVGSVTEENLYAHGIMDIVRKYDMNTEEGIQMYIAVVSLIEIFNKTQNSNQSFF